MIDDMSRYCCVYLLKMKEDTLDCSMTWLMPCWTLLDYIRHDCGWGLTLLNSYHILNRVPMKNKEKLHMKNELRENLHFLTYTHEVV
jgi:hypothetical protein